MDPLTQGVLGATFAAVFARKKKLKIAALCGAIGGMAPDLDILIRSVEDPLLSIEYHRHFTHSLFFVPFGGLCVALFLSIFLRKRASFKAIYAFATLGFLTHGVLDACTSYGTRLYWPLSDARVSWNIISIIDPIYTITLIMALLLCLSRQSTRWIRVGFLLSMCYLALGVAKHAWVTSYVETIATARQHKIERHLLNPTFANNILWRSVYQSGGYYYIDAIHMPLWGAPSMKEGEVVAVIDKEKIFPELGTASIQREDIRRFAYFSQDYIYFHPNHNRLIADLRYGTLPYDTKSFWGIRIHSDNPKSHVEFLRLRNINREHLDAFLRMLSGDLE